MSGEREKGPNGWCCDEAGAPRHDVQHQKLRRCFDWDYKRQGAYIITLTLVDRSRDWLGRLVGDETRGWSIEPTLLGEAVLACWRALAANWPGVEPREAQLMPEHFHAIVRVTTPQKHPLGQIVGSFKAQATVAARALATSELARSRGGASELARTWGGASGGALGGAGARAGFEVLARLGLEGALSRLPSGGAPLVPASLLAGQGLFSPGFQDTILWDLKRYRNERAYLLSNPSRLAVKRAHPELFKVVRDLAVDLAVGRGHFSAIGNHFLLQKSLFQVQCSRRDFAYRREAKAFAGAKGGLEIARDGAGAPVVAFASPTFEARRAAALDAAARGSVLISPCVSDGERQIAREALAAGVPLIVLKNKGFAPLQKPSGRYFDACAAGRLLMLAPANWPYLPGAKPMTRGDATALNRLCQWLAGDNAATINYHGLQPFDIDELAKTAARITPPRKGETTHD